MGSPELALQKIQTAEEAIQEKFNEGKVVKGETVGDERVELRELGEEGNCDYIVCEISEPSELGNRGGNRFMFLGDNALAEAETQYSEMLESIKNKDKDYTDED